MRLLSRYLLRQLALPFLFGLLALTGVMLLNVIGRRFAQLWGKGLPWSVIGEVFMLSLPFILAMSLPLAVLAATLYAFTQLATDSEITAMRAGGVSTTGMLRPVLGFAVVIGLLTFLFVDQVLPRANARLRNLYFDIGKKKPTFQLTENVVNPVPPSQFFLRASRIEPGTGRLTSVSIYDIGLTDRRRVIYADSGVMGYDPTGRDLILRLFSGSVQDVSATDRAAFQHTAFNVQEIVISDVFDQLERGEAQLDRGDREMTTCELLGVVDSARWEVGDAKAQRAEMTGSDLHLLLGLPPAPGLARRPAPTGPHQGGYCGLALRGQADKRETIGSPEGAQAQGTGRPAGDTAAADTAPARTASMGTGAADTAAVGAATGRTTAASPPAASPPDTALAVASPPARLSDYPAVSAAIDRERIAQRRSDRYLVEVHKKWSLAVASIPFVLIAVAMALRFPRGGMGLVMGGGMFVYAIFYVGLNAGESLADRGYVHPVLAMWSPNIVLLVLALIGLVGVSREYGSARGAK